MELFWFHLTSLLLLLYSPFGISTDDSVFDSQLSDCLNKSILIPEGLPILFNFTKRNSYIEILAQYEEKYDYYLVNWSGSSCYRAVDLERRPNTTLDEPIFQCDDSRISSGHDYNATFKCAYDIWTQEVEGDDYVIFAIRNKGGAADAYIINKSSNKVVRKIFSGYDRDRFIGYIKKVRDTDMSIKECTERALKLPQSQSFDFQIKTIKNQLLLISFFYENKYDYYEIDWSGHVKYFEKRLDTIPVRTFTTFNYSTEYKASVFRCPYEILDDQDYNIILIYRDDYNYPNPDNVFDDFNFDYYAYYYYAIKKFTQDVFYFNMGNSGTFKCSLTVPRVHDKTVVFENSIESCVNRKKEIPSNLNVSWDITRMNDHIDITIDYEGKIDFYKMNYKGKLCYFVQGLIEPPSTKIDEAIEQCGKQNKYREATICDKEPYVDLHTFVCGFDVKKLEDERIVALVIPKPYSDVLIYSVDRLTNQAGFVEVSNVGGGKLYVQNTTIQKSPAFIAKIDECQNLKYLLLNDLPIKFNVSKVNNHIEILVYDDGMYDYYELNHRGLCFSAVRMENKLHRTVEEQFECDALPIYVDGVDSEFSWFDTDKTFKCGFDIIKNETEILVPIFSEDEVYEYVINRATKKTLLYLYKGHGYGSKYEDKLDTCENRKYASEFQISLQATLKHHPDLDSYRYMELLVEYGGKYDLYATQETGYVRYNQLQLEDYRTSIHHTNYSNDKCRRYDNLSWRCPLTVTENENSVNISINALHYDNIYSIDKVTGDTKYFKIKDFPESISDIELRYRLDMNECRNKLLNHSSAIFPIEVVRNNDYLQIGINRLSDLKFIYITSDTGEICTSGNWSYDDEPKWLRDVYPECIWCDGPALKFNCPSISLEENDYDAKLTLTVNIYTLELRYDKKTGKYDVFISAQKSPNVSTLVKSLIG